MELAWGDQKNVPHLNLQCPAVTQPAGIQMLHSITSAHHCKGQCSKPMHRLCGTEGTMYTWENNQNENLRVCSLCTSKDPSLCAQVSVAEDEGPAVDDPGDLSEDEPGQRRICHQQSQPG